MGEYFKVMAFCYIQTPANATIEAQLKVALSTQETSKSL